MRKGISEEQIDNLCRVINEYLERISQNQSQIEEILSLIRENLKNDSSNELNSIIEQIRINNNNTKENIASYIDDLNKLQRNYELNDETISANLNRRITDLREE